MSVFISYRRDSGRSTAEAVYRALCGEYDVFLDTESLKNGYFGSAIKEQIENCDDFIVIVNETLFDRCSEPEDWILNEAAIALKMKKNIIPIFVGIEKFPANVPKPLEGICRYNGIFWNDEIITYQKNQSFFGKQQAAYCFGCAFGRLPGIARRHKKRTYRIIQKVFPKRAKSGKNQAECFCG